MDKRSKRILISFGVAILFLVVVEIVKPRPIDWNPKYTATASSPLGAMVAFEQFEDYFDAPVERITEDPYEFLQDNAQGTDALYFFVNSRLNIDPNQFEELWDFAAAGNTVFMSAVYFGSTVVDTLELSTWTDYSINEPVLEAQLYNPNLKLEDLPEFQKTVYPTEISAVDTTQTTALGYFDYTKLTVTGETQETDLLNYARMPVGEGWFYFHTLPQAFSNYYMLKDNYQYTARVLSYLKPKKVYWDEYLKDGRVIITSPLRFVLNQQGLKWAYYLAIGGILLFVFVRAKREQRMIPVVEPLRNDTKDFTATIGNLHFQYKNYSNIIAKRITYFLERVRSEYYLNTDELDETFATRLASKSGNSLEESEKLVRLINKLKGKTLHTEADLIELNKALEQFSN